MSSSPDLQRSIHLPAWFAVLVMFVGIVHAETRIDPARVGHYGVGETATPEQIAGWDIDVRPDGTGLPTGSGSVADGEVLYEEKCSVCHGSFGEGVGRYPVLAGGQGSLTHERPERTVGSFWPWTSTLFDYIRRAMPFTEPQSLSVEQTYAITAYVLYLNEIVGDDFVLDQDNLAAVRLPNESGFLPDARPDTRNRRCMRKCADPGAITIVAEVAGMSTEPVADSAAATAAGQPVEGRIVYDRSCSICHQAGVGGAPVIGNRDHWRPRIGQGFETLLRNAINGVSTDRGVMPPKGGFSQLSEEEVAGAVRYMIGESS